ncbi:EcsC family protein [Burkholderia cepacia]|uniref:EcsC family protein n=1 Tax=Burkholderia cepacia TaxID=292 RepID=A0AAQ0F9Q0_BURCE|nr:EcsC family protein [Burkholderia cepacia]MCE4129858.1 EcsC family protein [Burkholderia cepacia]MDN7856290.1 EcsC family protein [Burkholderia cepacia]RAQ05964.1 EcsC family protein [Burkholderia cepacia]
MGDLITQEKIIEALQWTYDKAVNGVMGTDSAEDMAAEYSKHDGTLVEKVDSLIRWQNTKAGAAGFVTGLGGFATMPVTIPTNLASVLYVQIRMIAAIAKMGGHDLKNDKIRTLVLACLAGDGTMEILRDVGIQAGKKAAQIAINKISGAVITKINQAVGFRLVTKAGSTGVVNLTKMVPFLGGVIGAAFDATVTNMIGNAARDIFITGKIVENVE